MNSKRGETLQELWAVVTHEGKVVWSRGGSSTCPKLMIYDSQKKAEAALKNSWTRQIYKDGECEIKRIYSVSLRPKN